MQASTAGCMNRLSDAEEACSPRPTPPSDLQLHFAPPSLLVTLFITIRCSCLENDRPMQGVMRGDTLMELRSIYKREPNKTGIKMCEGSSEREGSTLGNKWAATKARYTPCLRLEIIPYSC